MAHLLSQLRDFLDRELEPLARKTMTTPGPEQPLPSDISKLPLKSWDKGVFSSELVKLHIVPSVDIIGLDKGIAESEVGPGHVEEVGTSRNTFCSS
jgi:hypothetical protein